MALSRLHTWIAGEVLTASDLNAEFNNIIDNLSAAVTGTMSDGTVASPGLQFFSDSDTGIYRIATNALGVSAGGINVFVASEYFQASAFRFPVKAATEAVFTAQPGRAYWQTAEGSVHIHTGSLIARIPALTGIQQGELVGTVNASGVSGATAYGRVQLASGFAYTASASVAVLAPFTMAGTARLVVDSTTSLALGRGTIPLKVGSAFQTRHTWERPVLGTGALAASTYYYIYARDNGGLTTLEASTTGHVTAPSGVEVLSGDETRTLVGAVRTNGSTQFVDSASQRFCASWFNRKTKSSLAQTVDTSSTTSGSSVAINTVALNLAEFLSWGDEETHIAGVAILNNSTSNGCAFTLGVDGSADAAIRTQLNGDGPSIQTPFATQRCSLLSEGYHTVQAFMSSVTAGDTTTAFSVYAQGIIRI